MRARRVPGYKTRVYVVMAVPGVEFELEGIKAVGAPGREAAACVAGDEEGRSSWQSTRGRCPVRRDGRHSHGLGGEC